MTDSLIAIVPAAGIGQRASRAGEPPLPKQYRLLASQPMLRLAVQALLADDRIGQVYVAVSPEDKWAVEALAGLPRTVCRPCGGATRAETVAAALAACGAADDDWVLVHDAARPGLPAQALARLIDACLPDAVGGLLALPVADTVKSQRGQGDASGLPGVETMIRAGTGTGNGTAEDSGTDTGTDANTDTGTNTGTNTSTDAAGACALTAREAAATCPLAAGSLPNDAHIAHIPAPPRVRATIDRDGLWLAQTPQMFRAGLLRTALAAAHARGVAVTDEASAIEAAGHAPLLVPGAQRNFKVTWPDDFELMEKWL